MSFEALIAISAISSPLRSPTATAVPNCLPVLPWITRSTSPSRPNSSTVQTEITFEPNGLELPDMMS